jgi:aminoglycoside phosphotransferase (APT) family kinase protein
MPRPSVAAPVPETPLDFPAALGRFLVRATGDPSASVDDWKRHTEGFSMETVSFSASWADAAGVRTTRRLLLRRQPEAGLLEPYDLRPQVQAMRALAATMAIPRLHWFEEDPQVLGAPFYVMDFVEGDVPMPVPLPDGSLPIADEAEREALAADLATNLSRLHCYEWRSGPLAAWDAPGTVREAAHRELATWTARFRRAAPGPMPMLSRALRELERRAAALDEDGPVVLVHGDFRTGNFLRSGPRIRAVLDWEMVHLGDPAEDLAWACSRLWRGRTGLAGLLVPCARFVELYEQAGGAAVSPARLAFYDLLAGVKMTAIMLTGLRAYSEGRTDDVRMAIFHHQLVGMNLVLAESLGLLPSLDA